MRRSFGWGRRVADGSSLCGKSLLDPLVDESVRQEVCEHSRAHVWVKRPEFLVEVFRFLQESITNDMGYVFLEERGTHEE